MHTNGYKLFINNLSYVKEKYQFSGENFPNFEIEKIECYWNILYMQFVFKRWR